MCGVLGQFKKKQTVDEDLFSAMRDTMFHRGPDGCGAEFFENGFGALGHRRLSIIDLSEAAKQPMFDGQGKVCLTFNGEIYNYKALKAELKKVGHVFNSNSDSEVLIYGYKEWGFESLLKKIKGMFAFALWDETRKKLFIARDRFGMKPLYYYKDENQFSFASELKAIVKDPSVKRVINKKSLADYFIYSYVPNPHCIWEDFYKLEPASFLEFDYESFSYRTSTYWELEVSSKVVPFNEAFEKSKELIGNSVKEHLLSDVPVGLFLSGGYDSSALLLNTDKLGYDLNTFSLGFDKLQNSEHKVAKLISEKFKTDHFELLLEENQDYFSDLKQLSYFYDEPYAISSMLTYYYVSKLASKHNKVVLSGDGGDEIFAGYNWQLKIHNYYKNKSVKRKIKTVISGKKEEFVNMYNTSMTGILPREKDLGFLDKELQMLIKDRGLWLFKQNYMSTKDTLKDVQYLDFKTFIPQPSLTRADRSSMANSIEVRVPFLDHELFEYFFSLHSSVYHKEGVKKAVLEKQLFDHLPKEVFQMPKSGFSFRFLSKIFDNKYEDYILNGNLVKNGIISKNINFKNINYLTKFHLLMLELWFENYN